MNTHRTLILDELGMIGKLPGILKHLTQKGRKMENEHDE